MGKILIVDDEEKIRTLVRKYATFEGHTVEEAQNGMEAVQKAGTGHFDLILMDVMMPELDGFSAVKKIRETLDTPVIMLSARGEEYDRIHGFESGVDDYVIKPFSPKELMMRVEAVLKRSGSRAAARKEMRHDVFSKEGVALDFTAQLLTVDGEKVPLSPREYGLLAYLIRNRNIALSREKLITDVWGYDFYGDDRTLDTHIKMLRKALGLYSHFIVTVRGVGYRFEA